MFVSTPSADGLGAQPPILPAPLRQLSSRWRAARRHIGASRSGAEAEAATGSDLPPARRADAFVMELTDVQHARRDPGFAVLEGFHAIKHAVRFGGELLGTWTADPAGLEALRARLAPDVTFAPSVVPAAELAAVVPRAQVVAVARRPAQPGPDALLAAAGPRPVVLLEAPRHLGNLGACVRVAAATGAAGVMSTGELDPWHPDALRGSAGLHFALPVVRSRELRTGDRPLVALDPDGERLDAAVVPPRAVLAFGTERDGLSEDLLARADARLALPMRPGVSSLNLATAVSAVLFVLAMGRPEA